MPENDRESVYTDLQLDHTKREVRLLHFALPEKDGAIADTESLNCVLERVSFADEATLDFIALSYVWGDPNDKREIYVNGTAIWITRNLDSALRAYARIYSRMVRRGPHTEDILPLWADGICINQDSKDERGHQVSLMMSIYTAASFVFVWLGEGSPTTRLAIKLLRELAHQSDLVMDIVFPEPQMASLVEELFDAKTGHFEALFQFLKNPWFTRLWVIQEFAAAKPCHILMWCGYDWIHPSYLCRMVKTLLQIVHMKPLSGIATSIYNAELIDNLLAIDQIFFVRGLHLRRWLMPSILKLCVLIGTSQRSSCTVPHDVIYALLGIAEQIRPIPDLYPDYRLPIGTLFAKFFKTAVESTGSLILLSYVKYNPERTMPSWVPNWNDKRPEVPTRLVSFKTLMSNDDVGTKQYSACNRTIADCKFTPQLSIFLCYEFATHTVKPLHAGRLRGSNFTSEQIYSWIKNVLADANSLWVTGGIHHNERAFDALWRTMIADRLVLKGETYCPAPKACEEIFRIMSRRSPWDNDEIFRILSHRLPWDDDENDLLLSSRYFIPFFQAVASACRYRTLYLTTSGWFGLGPEYMQPDDKVCILFGGDVPYLLRDRKNGAHTFIGETYVHGIMHGEAMTNTESQERLAEQFIIT